MNPAMKSFFLSFCSFSLNSLLHTHFSTALFCLFLLLKAEIEFDSFSTTHASSCLLSEILLKSICFIYSKHFLLKNKRNEEDFLVRFCGHSADSWH